VAILASDNAMMQAVAVRVGEETKNNLLSIAEQSGRILTHLVRSAVVDYFALTPVPVPPVSLSNLTEDMESLGELGEPVGIGAHHINFRLPTPLLEAVKAHAQACGCTVSDIIRHAIDLWLATVDVQELGSLRGGVR
jgi:predicted DNA-binding protein